MIRPQQSRRLAAAAALMALLLSVIAVVRIVIADPLGWISVSGGFALLLMCIYWFAFGRTHQRLLASLVGIASLALLAHFIYIAPSSNLWNVLFALVLLGIASLAGKQALSHEIAGATQPEPASGDGGICFEKMTLLINPKSGGGKAKKFDIVEKARALGVDVKVLRKEDDLQTLAREAAAAGAEVLAMGGGDGSLGLVAAVAMEFDIPFICIPVGTRNHFAMDIGLNRADPAAALAAFDGEERLIDVATVGDRVFLNNASFGVYAATLQEPNYREAKAAAFRNVISSALNSEREPFDLRFDTPKGRREKAFIVFVGNNPYEFIGIEDFGGRRRLDQGSLQITVIEAEDHDGLANLAQGMIIGNPDFVEGFQQWTANEFQIDSGSELLAVGTDGEALEFPTPVTLRIHPRSLRVMVPQGTPLERPPGPLVFSPEGLQKLGELAR